MYNTTVRKILGKIPFLMLYGKEAQNPIDLNFPKPPNDPRLKLGEVSSHLSEKLYEVHSHAQMSMGKEQRRQKTFYKGQVRGKPYNLGDLVWLLEPHKVKQRKFNLP